MVQHIMRGVIYKQVLQPGANIKIRFGFLESHVDWAICSLDGYLDNQNTPQFLEAMHGLMTPDIRVLGLDLNELSYTSSTGVGAFSALTLESRQIGRFFFLTGVPERIAKVLKLLGFGDLFTIVDDPPGYDFNRHLN